MEAETKHKRRVRYSGTHPRSYKEKYKEHNPEKYADTIEKVIKKGSTPAGMHISIMVPGAGTAVDASHFQECYWKKNWNQSPSQTYRKKLLNIPCAIR